MENYVRIADYIYGVKDDLLYVNQFVSSRLYYEDQGFSLIQNTTLPGGDNVNIEIRTINPLPLKLAVRIPSWSGNDYRATINGKTVDTKPAAGSYLLIERVWKDGDILDITFTPQLWYSLLPVTNSFVSFGYGPVVLAARFRDADVGADLRHRYGPYDGEPVEVPTIRFSTDNIEDYVEVADINKLHFRVRTLSGEEIDLVPFYDILTEHFSVYLPVDIDEFSIYEKRVDPSEHI